MKYFIKYLLTCCDFLQSDDKTTNNRMLKKRQMAENEKTEKKSESSDRASGLNTSLQVDEYNQDTSDEEVRL